MINLTLIIISAIIMTIVGFITTKIWGIDIPKMISDTVAILILTLPIMFYNPQSDIEEMIQFLQNYIMTFINIIVPAVIGDAFGTAVSNLIDEFGR
jgi:hypothetical protein